VIRLPPVTREDAATATALVGARLAGVTYHYLMPLEGPPYAGGGDGVDADLSAVYLDFVDGASAYPVVAPALVDAGDREAWRGHRGETITSVGAAWQDSGDDGTESLWEVRLDFSTGSVVIALGPPTQAWTTWRTSWSRCSTSRWRAP
jgi:hypothetical protein